MPLAGCFLNTHLRHLDIHGTLAIQVWHVQLCLPTYLVMNHADAISLIEKILWKKQLMLLKRHFADTRRTMSEQANSIFSIR